MQFLRLMLAGVFDRFPDLQVIVGHWGELVLFYLDRLDSMNGVTGLQRPVSEFFATIAYFAPSGLFSRRYLQWTSDVVGVDRILFSTLVAAHLAQIRGLGATVSIDDFGSGYTSIGQLPTLPADTLKIDRSFIASPDPRQRQLVALMIAAAHAFNLRVVADGIEDPHTLHAVRNLGCDDAQGYLLAKPMPAHQVPAWLDAWPTHRATILPADSTPEQTTATTDWH